MKTAFPQYQGTTNIRLYSNIPFDNTYQHHSMISKYFVDGDTAIYTDTTETKGLPKERFINRKKNASNYYYPRFNLSGEFNFDYSNGLICSVVLELTPRQTNANYMRVESHNSDGNEYYYYFITGITQLNADTYRLSLELDVLMTYQDEFLEGIKNVPVMTNRKHCHRYTSDGLMPFGGDLKTGEDTFAGVKPSVIEGEYELHYEIIDSGVEELLWLYLCCDTSRFDFEQFPAEASKSTFTCNGVQYPFVMIALPINKGLTIKKHDGTTFASWTETNIKNMIAKYLINNGCVKGSKVSSYPPIGNNYVNISTTSTDVVFQATSESSTPHSGDLKSMIFKMGEDCSYMTWYNNGASLSDEPFLNILLNGGILIQELNITGFEMEIDTEFQDTFANTLAPSIISNRYPDPKLLFEPFKKYVLMAQYTSEGQEFYPELMFSEYVTESDTYYFNFRTYTTPYIGDYSVFTYIKEYAFDLSGVNCFQGYRYNRVGLSGSMNYTIPVGENALEVFNATQQQSFYQSKTASGITAGLSIAGGVGSVALGVAGMVGSLGMSTPASIGLIAGGATAIAGGIASLSNTIKSANAKIEDLKNTPDSISVAGSNFISDYTIVGSYYPMPFVSIYSVPTIVKEQANDYFYNFGYQVARECYFNNNLAYTPTNHKQDNNIFGRQIFNYVQLHEDITNKINAEMPIIIKQKISNIFNQGITLWSFFGNTGLWSNNDNIGVHNPDNWFMKCKLDNTEYGEYE